MELKTNHLGIIEYEDKNIILFEDGILGFEDYKKYIIVLSIDKDLPFHYLQSIEDVELSFMITNPFIFASAYDFELPMDDVNALKIESPKEVSIYSIVTIPEVLEDTSINLAAPLVINNTINQGRQVVLNEGLNIKYFIFSPDREDE